ncbi:hypothetical protein [Ponticaulis profundi]|uniref:Uncharacterized protein n=1 Tax=Ponticaulis profundi TaxID=2665222 RepID=A0ABW1SEP1_9PROT
MATRYWFKRKTSALDFGRPANWKGWVALLIFIFLFALIVQMIGAWIFSGFSPLASGVWLFALLFILIGAFLKLNNHFSPPTGEA